MYLQSVFWGSLKYEDIYLKAYESGIETWQGIKQYMRFYNYECHVLHLMEYLQQMFSGRAYRRQYLTALQKYKSENGLLKVKPYGLLSKKF